MDEIIRSAIACVSIGGAKVRGTAFLVAEDLVATALHVIAEKTDPPTFLPGSITLSFADHSTTAVVVQGAWDTLADCVLLRCVKPPKVRPLPLRSVERSGGAWETFGFPNLQPVDGMVVDGTVKFHAAKHFGYPVIQLFCNELAASSSGSGDGLSGAPVIMGDAAVGVMRFAHHQGGTLIASKIVDLEKLLPNQLKIVPGARATPVLASVEGSDLADILAKCLSIKDLALITLFYAGVKLDERISSSTAINDVVVDVIKWAEQRGPGTIDVLLNGALIARPNDTALHDLCNQQFPDAVRLRPPKQLVRDLNRALVLLIGLANEDDSHDVLTSYRRDFEKSRGQIGTINIFRELLLILQSLEIRNSGIEVSIERLKIDPSDRRDLRACATDLKLLASEARSLIANLIKPEHEAFWIDRLHECADTLITKASSSEVSFREIDLLCDELRRVAQMEGPRINHKLVVAAKELQLDAFSETMDAIVQRMDSRSLGETVVKRLFAGSRAVSILRSILAGTINQYDRWQEIDRELNVARSWERETAVLWYPLRVRIIQILDIYPETNWAQSMRKTAERCERCLITESLDGRGAYEFDDAFSSLGRKIEDRLMNLNRELGAVTDELPQAALPLDNLLQTLSAI